MEIVTLEPTEVKVKEGMDRYRQDMGDLEDLKNSIVRTRQILPIIITRENRLIDGGRRLAACMLAGLKVKAVYEDCKDDYEFRELELEANLHRKDYSPAEEALAIRDLHNLKQKRVGVGGSGTTDGWTIKKTAELLGKTRGTVYNALEMADLIDAFPDLKGAKKKSEIKKAGKSLIKLQTAMEGIKKHEQATREKRDFFELHHTDAVEHMEGLDQGSINLLCTDPLYGIGVDLIQQSLGGKTGGMLTSAGFKIEDPEDASFYYYYVLAHQSFRFTTPEAHGYVFIGPEHFWKVRDIFLGAGWLVHVKPFVWIKREVGQCNVPSAWPASCYEMCMYIRKEESRLVKEGQPDWVEYPPVKPSERLHPYEKPVPMLLNLLERIALPGQTLYDPFMGSASAIEAGVQLKLFSIGVDSSKEAYSQALTRMSKIKETKDEQ